MHKIFFAAIFSPQSVSEYQYFVDGYLKVDASGQIVAIGDRSDYQKDVNDEVYDFSGKLIIPGLIDCHLHLPQLDQMGRYGETLLGWLEKYIFPAEKQFEDNRVVEDTAQRLFKELKKNGVTTSVIYSSIHQKATDLAFQEAEKSGLRVIMGKTMMDQNSPDFLQEDTSTSLQESEKLCQKWHQKTDKLHYIFSPRFAPTCSPELMQGVGELAKKYGAYIQSHLNENEAEIKWVQELFPESSNYTDVYFKNNLLGPKTILGHGIHMTEEEFQIIKETETKIAHCPDSNFFLGSGRFPIEKYEEKGVSFGLASDIGAGTTLTMFKIMKMMIYMQMKAMDPLKPFYYATLGNAKVLSMSDKIGSLDQGKNADFLILNFKNIQEKFQITNHDIRDILANIIYCGHSHLIEKVYVQGAEL